jgi:O-antigen biosynthesis protein
MAEKDRWPSEGMARMRRINLYGKRVARRLRVEWLFARSAIAGRVILQLREGPDRPPLLYSILLSIYLVKRAMQSMVADRRLPSLASFRWMRREIESNFLIRLVVWRDWPIREPLNLYATYRSNNAISLSEKAAMRELALQWADRPLVSIVVPVYNAQPDWIDRLIESVLAQTYDRWELILVDDQSTESETVSALDRVALRDDRISVYRLDANEGVCLATNRGVEWSHGSWIAFVDHDDELFPDALWWVAKAIQDSPAAEVIYTDEEVFHDEGGLAYPHLKPGFSPQQLQAYNYICHLLVVKRSTFDAVGPLRPGTEGAQDFDLVLRLAERTDRFVHIPRVLYRWHVVARSMSRFVENESRRLVQCDHLDETTRFVVQDHFERIGSTARADIVGHWVMPRFERMDLGRVTIIIGTKDQPRRLRRCIESIERFTDYPNYEILILDNDNTQPASRRLLERLAKKHRVVRIASGPEGFNFSRLNNEGARQATSPILLFLNDDTEVLKPGWLSAMVGTLHFSKVEVVGARLLYPGRRNQHAGLILGAIGWGPWHALIGLPADTLAYGGYMTFPHNSIGVTGACMLTRRETFLREGGFDENELAVSFNDVDYCLRLFQKGGRIAYSPQAELIHDEGVSRGRFARPAEVLAMKRRSYGVADPYWNANYSRVSPHFAISPRRRSRGVGMAVAPRIAFYPATSGPSALEPILESLSVEGAITAPSPFASLAECQVLLLEGPLDADRREAMEAAHRANVAVLWSMPGRLMLPTRPVSADRADLLDTVERFKNAYQVVFSDPYSIGWAAAGLPRPNLELVASSLESEHDLCPVDPAEREKARYRWGLAPADVLCWAPLRAEDFDSTRFLIKVFASLPSEMHGRTRLVVEWDRSPDGEAVDRLRYMFRRYAASVAIVGPGEGGLAGADLVLAHETLDPRPRSVMRGLAYSKAVIGTPIIESGDLIHRPATGRVARAFDGKAWREAVRELIADASLRNRLGIEGNHWLHSRETWPDTIEHWRKLIVEAAEMTLLQQEQARSVMPQLEEITKDTGRSDRKSTLQLP